LQPQVAGRSWPIFKSQSRKTGRYQEQRLRSNKMVAWTLVFEGNRRGGRSNNNAMSSRIRESNTRDVKPPPPGAETCRRGISTDPSASPTSAILLKELLHHRGVLRNFRLHGRTLYSAENVKNVW
jgi:hypothetical protein